MSPSFGRKLTSGFQTLGRKLKKIDGQTIGRKITNTASKIDGVVQRVGAIASLIEPELAPAFQQGMQLSNATNSAIQSGSALAKKKGDNTQQLDRFVADYSHAKGQYGQARNSLERPQPIRSTESLDFA